MSRGLGKTQAAILGHLRDGATRSDFIAKAVYQVDKPEPAQIVAIRRAIRTLERAGMVECGEFYSYTGRSDQRDHAITNLYLFAWLPGDRPQDAPRTRFDTSEVETLILERLAAWGSGRRYDLSRAVRRQLTKIHGFGSYGYTSEYNRALHRLVRQGIVRFCGERVETTSKRLSVTT